MVFLEQYNLVITQLAELNVKFQTLGKKSRNNPGALTGKRSFSGIPTYSGKVEEVEDWRFHMRTFLTEEKGWNILLKKLELIPLSSTSDELNKMVEELVS